MIDVLDIGCGDGSWAHQQGLTEENYIGIDIDPDMVKEAREKGLNVYEMDAVQELPGGDYDEIYLKDVLEHVEAPEQVLNNARRVLKDSGSIYVQVPSEWSDNLWRDYTHRRAFTPDSIYQIANDADLKVEEINELKTGDNYIIKKLIRLLTGYRLDVNEYDVVLKP